MAAMAAMAAMAIESFEPLKLPLLIDYWES